MEEEDSLSQPQEFGIKTVLVVVVVAGQINLVNLPLRIRTWVMIDIADTIWIKN